MSRIETLARKVEELRTYLNIVIEDESELVNPKVINASQSLDKVLIQYYRVLGVRGHRVLKEGIE